MKRSERTVRYLDLSMTAYPEAGLAAKFSLPEILEGARRLLQQEQLQRRPRRGALQHVRLKDLAIDETHAAALFTLADRDTVDATYEKISDGSTRSFEKEEDEGMRFSAHLLIRLRHPNVAANKVSFFSLLEETRGLSPSAITGPLRAAVKKAGKSSYKTRDGDIAECFPLVTLEGHFSSSLFDELREGVLEGFTLIKNERREARGVDQAELVTERDLQLRLDVTPGWRDRLAAVFHSVLHRARQSHFDEIRIRYRDRFDRSKSHAIDVDVIDALQSLTVRSARITLATPMDYDQAHIDQSFIAQMITLADQG